jgi:hypothetical protein
MELVPSRLTALETQLPDNDQFKQPMVESKPLNT